MCSIGTHSIRWLYLKIINDIDIQLIRNWEPSETDNKWDKLIKSGAADNKQDNSLKQLNKKWDFKKYVGITENSTQFPVETQREGNLRVVIYTYPLFPLLYKSTTL